jgi:CDP-L-myo-inositol myo-inositolphosphotransferase
LRSTQAVASPQILVVLMPGPERRVLGLPVHERNARVAARAGARVVDAPALASYGSQPAMVVPADVMIDLPLFAETLPPAAAWLGLVGAVVAGPADEVAQYVTHHERASRLPRVTASAGGVMDATTAGAKLRAAWRILRQTEKPTDGWIARRFNRPVSRLFSLAMLTLGLRAHHASLLALLVGTASAIAAAVPAYLALVASGVLFHLASILDGVDGEMARATFTESAAGARLDAVVDQLTYLGCFAGVIIGWWREGQGIDVLAWGAVIAAALVLSLLRAGRFVARYAPNASFVFVDRSVRRAARDTGHRALRLAAAGFLLMRRDVFAVIYLVVALTGRRELVPALVLGCIVLANLTFSLYHRELEAAALLENRPAVP